MIFRVDIFFNFWYSNENSECILLHSGLKVSATRRKRREVDTHIYIAPGGWALEKWSHHAWLYPADCVALWPNAMMISTACTGQGVFFFEGPLTTCSFRDKFFLWHTLSAACLELRPISLQKYNACSETTQVSRKGSQCSLPCGTPYCRAIHGQETQNQIR